MGPRRRPGRLSVSVAILATLALGEIRALAGQSGAGAYAFPGLHGRVVAAETGQPLPGVSVLALWVGRRSGPALRTLKVLETESRDDGTFDVPAWNATLPAAVDMEASGLAFFAPGRDGEAVPPARLDAAPGPVEVRLRPFAGSPADWATHLKQASYMLALFWVALPRQALPKFISAMDREWRRLPEDVRGDDPNPREVFELMLEASREELEDARRRHRP
jgi:hypothetical protein